MEVTLIASTSMEIKNGDHKYAIDHWMSLNLEQPYVEDADSLSEFAGRACYQSWGRPNPKTATNASYLAHILDVGHHSVLEHASATFYVTGVSRSLTHELIRHRHLSYSQLSQRYVDESEGAFVVPPAIEKGSSIDNGMQIIAEDLRAVYSKYVKVLKQSGLSNKRAREAARAILPNGTETKIVVTGNMRAWLDFFTKRYHVAADAEIREFATVVLGELRKIAPNTFAGVPAYPYGSPDPATE